MEIGIIADDLTGAADATAAFAQRGYRANVGFRDRQSDESFPLAEGDALAYDTDTRDMPGDQQTATELTVRQAARKLAGLQPNVIFKKIDSTLRGHLRLELEAVRREFPHRLAIVCPAFPAQGRTIQAGILHIHDMPWTETEFAPPNQSKSLTVRGAFGMEGDEGAQRVMSGNIRQGVDGLEARLQAWRKRGVHTVFCDAKHEDALHILAGIIVRQPHDYLPVGSAGLAQAIAVSLPIRPPEMFSTAAPFYEGRVCRGGQPAHGNTAAIAALIRAAASKPRNRPSRKRRPSERGTGCERDLRSVCGGTTGRRADHAGYARCGQSARFSPLLAGVAERVCIRQLQAGQAIDAISICGGNTAIALCQMLGGIGLHIMGQWEPGMAIGRLNARPGDYEQHPFRRTADCHQSGRFWR